MILYMCVDCFFSIKPLLKASVLSSLSQVLGSTLALQYMRAEYCAPLGSTSLIFNFLFARFLVGTTITSTDIYVHSVSALILTCVLTM